MDLSLSYHQAGAPSTGSTRCPGEDHCKLAQAGQMAGGPFLAAQLATVQPPAQQVPLAAPKLRQSCQWSQGAPEVGGRLMRDCGRRSGGMVGHGFDGGWKLSSLDTAPSVDPH
jgi:hypothetical protein